MKDAPYGATAIDLQAAPAAPVQGYWRSVFSRLLRDKVTVVCALVILALILMAVFAPWIAPEDPLKGSVMKRLKPIGSEGYPLGSDELGRDMLSRLIFGARLSLVMGITPVLCALGIGSLLGITAGFHGGRVNTVIMRTIDVFYAFPSVLLAVAISGALGAGITNAILSLTIVFIPPIARVAVCGSCWGVIRGARRFRAYVFGLFEGPRRRVRKRRAECKVMGTGARCRVQSDN